MYYIMQFYLKYELSKIRIIDFFFVWGTKSGTFKKPSPDTDPKIKSNKSPTENEINNKFYNKSFT